MRIIDRYIMGNVALYVAGAVFAFSILIVCNNFYASASLLFDKKIPLRVVTTINLLDAPATIVLSLPVATLFGVMLAIGQFSRQNELSAMLTGGIPLFRIMTPVLVLALFLSLLTYILDEHLVPLASDRAYELRNSIEGAEAVKADQDVFLRNEDGSILYIGVYDTKTKALARVMLYEKEKHPYEREDEEWTRISVAFSGRFEGDELVLINAKSFLCDTRGELKGKEEIPELRRRFPAKLQEIQTTKRTGSRALAGGELAEQITRAQQAGRDPIAFQTDLQFKYSTPVACFIFSFVGFIFSVFSPRKETFMGMLYAIILVLIYYVFISVFKSLGKQGIIPYPIVSAWTTNVVFLIFGVYAFLKVRH